MARRRGKTLTKKEFESLENLIYEVGYSGVLEGLRRSAEFEAYLAKHDPRTEKYVAGYRHAARRFSQYSRTIAKMKL